MSRPQGWSVGTDRVRVDAPLKVTGTAPYAYEHPVDDPLYLHPVVASIARGAIDRIDATAAQAVPGVRLVLTHENAPRVPRMVDADLVILQSPQVAYHGQFVGAVVADTPEAAREAAGLVAIEYAPESIEAEFDREGPGTYAPKRVNAMKAGTTDEGDVEAALAGAAHLVEQDYGHATEHHTTMEPAAAIALWHTGRRFDPGATRLTLFDSNQGPTPHRLMLAPVLGLLPGQIEIVSPYVGGGFGSKAMPHPHLVLVALAAKLLPGRPVKYAMTRQQTFATMGNRAETDQRIRLGADADGRFVAVDHVSWAPTARLKEYVDQTCSATRMMYAGPARRTQHRTMPLDIAPATWMRAPGEFSGMFALETAIDELAHVAGIDPIELRRINEPDVDPETGHPWSTRELLACLDQGAERFGWADRGPVGGRREGEWLIGVGVASAVYPDQHMVPSLARIAFRDGGYRVEMQAGDIGTGAHTILPQIAADILGVPVERVVADIGTTAGPMSMMAGGSQGTYEWGSAIVAAARKFLREHGTDPAEGASSTALGTRPSGFRKRGRASFGAHFAQVRVSAVTGEVRVDRMLGVFAAGRIVNPRTARSQLIGGMTMGLSAALFEESVIDPRFGHVVNHDLAGYHIAAHADVPDIEVEWIDEVDPWFGPTGAKGIGELGIVGSPAAVGNAIHNATGIRLRRMPFTPDVVLEALADSDAEAER